MKYYVINEDKVIQGVYKSFKEAEVLKKCFNFKTFIIPEFKSNLKGVYRYSNIIKTKRGFEFSIRYKFKPTFKGV